ncbi:MAG: hypothetical protein AAGG68_24290 [Bacteroidota bacterium]
MKFTIIKTISLLFLLYSVIHMSYGQEAMPSIEEMQKNQKIDTLDIKYYTAANADEVEFLSEKMRLDIYPVAILHEDLLDNIVGLSNDYEEMTLAFNKLDKKLAEVEALRVSQIAKYEDIVELEQKRADAFKRLNEEMLIEHKNLSEQLDLSTKVTNRVLRGRNLKNISVGAIGGVIGFITGILVTSDAF